MKGINALIFGIVIFFLWNSMTYSFSYCPENTNNPECIEEEIDEKIEKKIKDQQQFLILGQELEFREKGTISYLENYIILLNLGNEINQSEIDIMNLEYKYCSKTENNITECSEDPEIDLFNTKISINDKDLTEARNELDQLLEKEKQIEEEAKEKAKQEREAELLREAENTSNGYLGKAKIEFEDGEYEKASTSYKEACKILKSFECYYGEALSSYEITKIYYKKSLNFPSKNEKLFKSTKEDTIEAIEKAIELSNEVQQKNMADTLLIEVSNYPEEAPAIVKEEPFEEKSEDKVKDSIDKKVDIIWTRLATITSKYSDEKKQDIYIRLITQLEKYKSRNTNTEIIPILDALIEKLSLNIENTKSEEIDIVVFDRTEEFYKTTLQEKTYSCELATASNILSTIKNKNISEDELIEQVEKSWFNKTAQYQNGIYIWGDPNTGFVGHIDKDDKGNIASQRNLTGYGVYEQPIAKLYEAEGLKTEIINNTSYTNDFGPEQHLQKILQEFTNGNYVQLWGDICTTPEYDDGELALTEITQEDVDNGKNAKNECWSFGDDRKRVWYYQDGEDLVKHQGLIGEHNFYLLGYEGNIANPTNIIVWDTSTGKHTYPVKEWMRKWEEMDFRSIIIYSE